MGENTTACFRYVFHQSHSKKTGVSAPFGNVCSEWLTCRRNIERTLRHVSSDVQCHVLIGTCRNAPCVVGFAHRKIRRRLCIRCGHFREGSVKACSFVQIPTACWKPAVAGAGNTGDTRRDGTTVYSVTGTRGRSTGTGGGRRLKEPRNRR